MLRSKSDLAQVKNGKGLEGKIACFKNGSIYLIDGKMMEGDIIQSRNHLTLGEDRSEEVCDETQLTHLDSS